MKIFSIFIFAFVLFNLPEQHGTKYLLVEVEGEEPPIVEAPKAEEGEPCNGGHRGEEGLPDCEEGLTCLATFLHKHICKDQEDGGVVTMNLQLGEDCGAIPHNEHSHNLGGCAPGLKCRKIHMGPKDTHGICVHQDDFEENPGGGLLLGEDCGIIPHGGHSHEIGNHIGHSHAKGGCATGLECKKIHMSGDDSHGTCIKPVPYDIGPLEVTGLAPFGGTGFRGKKNKCAKWQKKGKVAKKCRKPKNKNQPCCRNGVDDDGVQTSGGKGAKKCAKWQRKGTVAKQCRKPKHKNKPCCRNGVSDEGSGETGNDSQEPEEDPEGDPEEEPEDY